MEFNIKKGVPLPNESSKPRKYNLPLGEMEVDDHVTVDIPKPRIQKERKIISNFVLRYTYKNPTKKFAVRAIDDGVGVWRTK